MIAGTGCALSSGVSVVRRAQRHRAAGTDALPAALGAVAVPCRRRRLFSSYRVSAGSPFSAVLPVDVAPEIAGLAYRPLYNPASDRRQNLYRALENKGI
jgi:hypothetical protein